MVRDKVRLVAKHYVQKNIFNYTETIAAVLPFDGHLPIVGKFRLLGCHVHHADISTAFLMENIDGEMYRQ